MTESRAIYTLWLREVKRYFRERIRVVSSIIQPLLWLVIFGSAMRFSYSVGELTYQQVIFPGIICQSLLFTSMFMGVSVIWDREFGFLKEILVSPVSRPAIFIGKMLGNSTDALIQASFVFLLAFVIQVPMTPLIFLSAFPIMILISFGIVCIGLTIASFIDSLESFGVIQNFVTLPLFFLSGALFPLTNVPPWLQTVSLFNPLSYGVDALRTIILGSAWPALFPFMHDIMVIIGFDAIMIIIGTAAFSRRR